MNCTGATAGIAAGALRLLHLGPHGMQIVAGRDYGKEQNQGAAEGPNKDERVPASSRNNQNGSSSPQDKGGQQQ